MKKIIVLSIFFVIFSFYSCEKPVTTTVTTVATKITMTEPGTNGFLISQEIVVRGNTVWGFSEKAYGTGMQWRDIVAQNPFLQRPGRVYYNKAKRMWVVKIYPGEVIRIGGDVIIPSCVFEETTNTVETTESPKPIIPWWGWLLIITAIAFIIWLFYHRPRNNSNAVVNVNFRHGENINTATQTATVCANIERSYQFREHVATQMLSNPNLQSARLTENSDQTRDFILSTEYRETQRNRE